MLTCLNHCCLLFPGPNQTQCIPLAPTVDQWEDESSRTANTRVFEHSTQRSVSLNILFKGRLVFFFWNMLFEKTVFGVMCAVCNYRTAPWMDKLLIGFRIRPAWLISQHYPVSLTHYFSTFSTVLSLWMKTQDLEGCVSQHALWFHLIFYCIETPKGLSSSRHSYLTHLCQVAPLDCKTRRDQHRTDLSADQGSICIQPPFTMI